MAEMTTTIYDLTVIGAGPGGYEAALEAAKLGLRTALIEKDSLGGTCLNRGCIPTKTLLHSSELYKEICDAERFGISAEHVQADLNNIQQHKQTTIATLQKGIAALLKAAKVTMYQGLGTVIDTGTDDSNKDHMKQVQITADGADPVIIQTRQILLASGSVPSVPPIPGHDLPDVMTSDELLSWDQEPFSSLLIIGGGVIGVEFAGIWQALGTGPESEAIPEEKRGRYPYRCHGTISGIHPGWYLMHLHGKRYCLHLYGTGSPDRYRPKALYRWSVF